MVLENVGAILHEPMKPLMEYLFEETQTLNCL